MVFALTAAVVVAFQLCLAAGAPWGAYAMGGRYPGRFPAPMRIGAVIQAGVVAALAVVVLSDADVLAPGIADTLPWLIWLVVAFATLSTILNAITRSAVERRLWLPVALALLVTSLVVAVS